MQAADQHHCLVAKNDVEQQPAIALTAIHRGGEDNLFEKLPEAITRKVEDPWGSGMNLYSVACNVAQGAGTGDVMQETHIALWFRVLQALVQYPLSSPLDWFGNGMRGHGQKLKRELEWTTMKKLERAWQVRTTDTVSRAMN